jgi:hypothetical protein
VAGLRVWESDDILIVRLALPGCVRLNPADIVARYPAPHSFMPGSLLSGLPPQSLADLYAFLRALQP